MLADIEPMVLVKLAKVGYLFTYALILALEHWIKSQIVLTVPPIAGSFSNPTWPTPLVSRPAEDSAKRRRGMTRDQELIEAAERQNENCLNFCYLKEIIALIDNLLFAARSKVSPDTLGLANKFMTRVAHPTRLLVLIGE